MQGFADKKFIAILFLFIAVHAKASCEISPQEFRRLNFEEVLARAHSYVKENCVSTHVESDVPQIKLFYSSVDVYICEERCNGGDWEKNNQIIKQTCSQEFPDGCFLKEQIEMAEKARGKEQNLDFEMMESHCGKNSSYACAVAGIQLLEKDCSKAEKYLVKGCQLKSEIACSSIKERKKLGLQCKASPTKK